MQDTQGQGTTAAATKERTCTKCDGKMVQRKSKFGTFYGCANFPKCAYKERQ